MTSKIPANLVKIGAALKSPGLRTDGRSEGETLQNGLNVSRDMLRRTNIES